MEYDSQILKTLHRTQNDIEFNFMIPESLTRFKINPNEKHSDGWYRSRSNHPCWPVDDYNRFSMGEQGQEKQSQHLQPSSAIETSHETKAYSLNGYYIFM